MPAAPDATLRLLDHAFLPRSVAVVGASSNRGKWSNDVFRLLIGPASKTIAVPINPNRDSVEGVGAYPSVSDVPHPIDYALIVVPRDHVLASVRDCVSAKVPVVHVLSAGFGEAPGHGRELQEKLKVALAGSDTVLIGPNSMGLYSAKAGLTFASGCHFNPGLFSFVSQSGGICYEVLMRGQTRGLSFSKILSVGNCADLDWPDYVRYFADDKETGALALYIESVADGRALFDELKRASKIKPVFVLKGGKSQLGSESVISHTGRLAGEYDLWKAMLHQARVHEVGSVSDLLIAMQAWEAGQPIVANSGEAPLRAMVVGTGGGATVLVADACEDASLTLATLDVSTVERLNSLVPEADSLGGVGNPLDVGADRLLGDPGLLAHLTEAACADPGVNAVLIHLNLIAAANNLPGGLESWERTCDDLAAVGRTDKAIVLVLRNSDGGAKSEELGQSAVRKLRGKKGIHVFSDLTDGLKFLSGVGARISPAGAVSVRQA